MTSNSNTNVNAPKFFVEHKKGEVTELMNLLKNPTIDKDPKKKKDIIKRVIAYMTLGVDVSKLFHEMVKASYINDLVTKKMVYLYIVNYAEESDAAFLAINTFLNDLKNDNPKIRGLALRNLCSLKFKGAYEYFAKALYDSIKDPHPYVRKTAVLAMLKVYKLNPKLISDKDIDTLYEMIKDSDPMVVSNTLFVLNEILRDTGGITVTNKMINHLLNFISEFNEWGQNIILELISKYKPKDDKNIISIINSLEEKDFLKHSSTSIVLATCKIFIAYTKDNKLYSHVVDRIKDPLITLLSASEMSGNHEMSYIILSHIILILRDGSYEKFYPYYKKFYVFCEEPFYIKKLKLDILCLLSNEKNFNDIIVEMEEYANDVNLKFARFAIEAIGEIAMRVQESLDTVINIFKKFLGRKVDYVISQTVVVLESNF
jgi:AP-4 complex subunit beta-1